MADTSNMPANSGRQVAPVAMSMPEPIKARTELGRKLREIREKIVASGQSLFDENGLRREIRDRRGGPKAED